MAQPTKNPFLLPGSLATFVAENNGETVQAEPPPTITATFGNLASMLGVSAPLSLKTAAAAIKAIPGGTR